MLPPSICLPVMGEIADVNMASLGRYHHGMKTRTRWAEWFPEPNGWWFGLESDGLRQVNLAKTHHITIPYNRKSDDQITWWLYSAARLGYQATTTMIQYPTQSHYPDTELTRPCPILLMLRAMLGTEKYQFCNSLFWLDWEIILPMSHMGAPYSTDSGNFLKVHPSMRYRLWVNEQHQLVNNT